MQPIENDPVLEWFPIPGYEGLYEITRSGVVRNVVRGNIMTQTLCRTGYLTMTFHDSAGRQHTESRHRLLGKTFLPNPANLPVVRHLDDDRSNNQLENLAWGTHADNAQDKVRNGHWRGKGTRPLWPPMPAWVRKPAFSSTHCKYGHEWTEETSYWSGNRRRCRPCNRIAGARSRAKRDQTKSEAADV
jgi:hypothetical protein